MAAAIAAVEEARAAGRSWLVASLDHDLGDSEPDGGDGVMFVRWTAEHEIWPVDGLRVHSSNPVGAGNMLATVDRYGPYRSGIGSNARGRFTLS